MAVLIMIEAHLVYGLISRPLHKALTLRQALVAFVLFTLFMLLCSIAKDRAIAWWRERQARGARAHAAPSV